VVVGDNVGRMGRLDDHLGHGFVLLGAGVDPAELLTPEEKKQWDALGARYVAVRPQNAYTRSPGDLVDLEQVILPWLRKYGATAVAVRPDKFVAAADVTGLAVPDLPAI
jgi:3-(3-hydroxy-phenyl)propionate hydroxylase